jgi:hypothetical protein
VHFMSGLMLRSSWPELGADTDPFMLHTTLP